MNELLAKSRVVQSTLLLKYAIANGLIMAQRSSAGSSRGSGRGYGIQRHEKAKTKTSRQKRQSVVGYAPEKSLLSTPEEVVEKTLGRLSNLGKQKFALSPFSYYFDPWMRNLKEVLLEFESTPRIRVDDQFVKEISQTLSTVQLQLDERLHIESSNREASDKLSKNRILLKQIEKEYIDKARENAERKNIKNKRLSVMADSLKQKQNSIDHMKTGIFRGFSEKAKAHRKMEVKQELDSVQQELQSFIQRSIAEQSKLEEEYERKKKPITEEIAYLEKQIEELEVDSSLGIRENACQNLVDSINSLLRRMTSQNH